MRYELAGRLVSEAIAEADRRGARVSVAILDAAGHLVAMGRMDGARFITPEIAAAKALTSAAFQVAGSALEGVTAGKEVFFTGVTLIRAGSLAIGAGSVPVYEAAELVGSVGVSGSAPAEDEAIAAHAVRAVGLATSL